MKKKTRKQLMHIMVGVSIILAFMVPLSIYFLFVQPQLGFTPEPQPRITTTVYVRPRDSDGDGLSDTQESQYGTNPHNPDTDGDGWNDWSEIQEGTDPRDEMDYPGSVTTTPATTTTEDTFCGISTMECGSECINLGYDVAECVHGNCKLEYNYIGDYGCSEEPGCDICCCGYSGITTTTQTTTTTIPGETRCSDYMWNVYNLPNTEFYVASDDCLNLANSRCGGFVEDWSWVSSSVWGSEDSIGCCGWKCSQEYLCLEDCQELYEYGTSIEVTGDGTYDCRDYADNWCVQNCGGEGYDWAIKGSDCCCWTCINSPC